MAHKSPVIAGVKPFHPGIQKRIIGPVIRTPARYVCHRQSQPDVLLLPCPNGSGVHSPTPIQKGLLSKGHEVIGQIQELMELLRLKERKHGNLAYAQAFRLPIVSTAQAKFDAVQALCRSKVGSLLQSLKQITIPLQQLLEVQTQTLGEKEGRRVLQ